MLLNAKIKFLHLSVVLLIIYFFIPFHGLCQSKKPGSIEYLSLCNGYHGITLGSNVNLIPRSKLFYLDDDSRLDADSCYKFEYRDSTLLRAGNDLYLDLVGIRTYKNKIINIYLFFKRKDGYKVLNNFLATYGVFTSKPDDYSDIYDWHTSSVDVSLRYELKNDLGIAIYSYNHQDEPLEAMQKTDKKH